MSEDRLRSCFSSNPDGAGFAYVRKGKVEISKGHMKFEDFWRYYTRAVRRNPRSNFLIHFRIGTSGTKGEANTHPFEVPNGCLIHNGIMFDPDTVEGNKSDTNVLCKEVSSYLDTKEKWIKAKTAVGEAIGRGNKFCLLFDDNDYVIVNEQEGNWEAGVWYSNTYGYNSRAI